jgi:hypothetical protein
VTASSPFERALSRARETRSTAESIRFKLDPRTAASTDQRIDALGAWLKRRLSATDDARHAYEAAMEHAAPAEQVLIRRELGELHFELFEAQVESALSILPGVADAPPERVALFRATIMGQFSRDSSAARESFVKCLMLSSQLGLKTPDAKQCEERIRAIDALNPEATKREAMLEDWRFVHLDAGKRKRRPVAQRNPCVLSGSVETTWTRLYADATAPEYVVTLADFDVVDLELSKRSDQRLKITIDYPFQASGYVDADAGLIETTRRFELLKQHLWLDPGTTVRAFDAKGGQAKLTRNPLDKSTPQVALRVPCSQLGLASPKSLPSEDPSAEISQVSGVVPLHSTLNGPVIGRLNADLAVNVRVLERKPGWVRVTTADAGARMGSSPFEFDAWIAERFAPLGKEAFAVLGLFRTERAPTHVTTALLPLRLSPDPAAPVIAELVAGVAILAGEQRSGMRRIRFNEAHGNNEGNDFWVVTAELSAHTTPWKSSTLPNSLGRRTPDNVP